MSATVWCTDFSAKPGRGLLDKIAELLDKSGLESKLGKKGLTAVKLHFGEKGNTSFVRPIFVRAIVERIAALGGKPFLTDTNTLYLGSRANSVDHLRCAITNGFAYSVVDAPLVIADGLRGEYAVKVPIDGKIFREVAVGGEIVHADSMVVVTHFKGHELSGFGGTIKNLGMGCAARQGKLAQHSSVAPVVKPENCTSCGTCIAHCPAGAIEIVSEAAFIDPKICIGCADCIVLCPEKTISVNWNEASATVQKKMVEHALGAVKGKKERVLYIAFVNQVSPYCDCYGHNDRPMAPDVGILASDDPVALDQACADLVIKAAGRDPFRETHPAIDWTIQLAYGEELGLGKRAYKLETI
ncbi:MAG TPA: DUF362 domain-containing protein [Candidatus Deferrimicrobiaceae bacterium]|jgi:hypothetical protein